MKIHMSNRTPINPPRAIPTHFPTSAASISLLSLSVRGDGVHRCVHTVDMGAVVEVGLVVEGVGGTKTV